MIFGCIWFLLLSLLSRQTTANASPHGASPRGVAQHKSLELGSLGWRQDVVGVRVIALQGFGTYKYAMIHEVSPVLMTYEYSKRRKSRLPRLEYILSIVVKLGLNLP
jgi:hypothetical protein